MKTKTGDLDIGFRVLGSAWQKDPGAVIAWARENGFSAIDIPAGVDAWLGNIMEAGLRIGSADLPDWTGLISADKGKRRAAMDCTIEHVKCCAEIGTVNHFALMLPEDPEASRQDNFGYMVKSYGELASVMEDNDAKAVVEGWPGPGALCCTPETLKAFFKEIPSPAMGVNYDPSHLVRMGIDPVRFLHEFSDRVYHVHGKDTKLLEEELYQFGNTQPATFAKVPAFGSTYWRYTIPGHGEVDWPEILGILKDLQYSGCVSIELEDADFNGSEEGEKEGLLKGGQFLEGC